MNYSTILTALNARLRTVPALPPLQEENTRVKMGSGTTTWCRATLIPAQTVIGSIGVRGWNALKGFYQIDLMNPPDAGYISGYNLADNIIKKFVVGTNLNGVIIRNSYVSTSNGNVGLYVLPVIIEWEYFEQRPTIT